VPGGAFDEEDEFESEPDWDADEASDPDYRGFVSTNASLLGQRPDG